MSFAEAAAALPRAVIGALADSIKGISIRGSVTSRDVARAAICAAWIIFTAMLQTTVMVRFKPFGAVPDMMLALTVAIAFSEGERWGGVCGLIAAFIIESVGGVGLMLSPLLYMPAGFFGGVLARNYLSDSIPSRAAIMSVSLLGRAVITLINSVYLLNATLPEIFTGIVLPEMLSTALMSVPVLVLVWVSLRHFHKTRAEKTEKL